MSNSKSGSAGIGRVSRHGLMRASLLMSAAGFAIALSSAPARAECAPEGGAIFCSGIDDNGYVSNVTGQVTTVLSGAKVRKNAITNAAFYYDENGHLVVNGAVDGGDGDGVVAGPGRFVTIAVGKDGSISGQRGIAAVDEYVRYAISNAGMITGTAGPAIMIPDGSSGHIARFRNAATGQVVGGIDARFERIENEGLIDGGMQAGIRSSGAYYDQEIRNSGTIRSNAAGGAAIAASAVIDNSGTIEGSGDAVAIRADELELRNRAGAVVRGGNGVAIELTGAVFDETDIDNAGTIIGDVVSRGESNDRFVQRMGATVQGNISLGGGDDAFYFEQTGDVIAGGVSGAIDGGDGYDTFGVRVTKSGTVTLGDSLPAGFERYGVDLCGCDTDATIAAGSYTNGLLVSGEGDVVSYANITASGVRPLLEIRPTLEPDVDSDFGLSFTNKGVLDLTGTSPAAILIEAGAGGPLRRFVNDGTIRASGQFGKALDVEAFGDGTGPGFVNNGSITGASEFGSGVALNYTSAENNGSIVFTGTNQTALTMDGGSGLVNNVTGTIRGTLVGVNMSSGDIVNRGTIAGEQNTGIVAMNGTIVNDAGGVISGAVNAIRGFTSYSQLKIANKGTLNGAVDLGTAGTNNDVYWAAEGGTLSGQLKLSDGDKLIADISRLDRNGNFRMNDILAGGMISTGTVELWLRADRTQSANVVEASVDVAGKLVYEAAGADTVLTLGGPLDAGGAAQTATKTIHVAGDGKIDLVADIDMSGSGNSAVVVEDGGTGVWFDDAGKRLDLTLSGKIKGGSAAVHVDALQAGSVELAAGKGDISFTQGTGLRTGSGTQVLIGEGAAIRVTDAATPHNAIALEGNGSTIVNRGSIVEEGDAAASTPANRSLGVALRGSILTNEQTGKIDMIGSAVAVESGGVILNAGLIQSRGGIAIDASASTDETVIDNLAGGSIIGQGVAILGRGGSELIRNAGSITGDVNLGDGNDAFIATGGAVTGSVSLGGGDDSFLVRDGVATGVSGTIDAGGGLDAYGRSFTSSGDYALSATAKPDDFELFAAEAAGEDTRVRLSATGTLGSGMRLFGDGEIENTANFNVTGLTDQRAAFEVTALPDQYDDTLNLINRGTITTDVRGVEARFGLGAFANHGTIDAALGAISAEGIAYNGRFRFQNTGMLTSGGGDVSTVSLTVYGADDDGLGVEFSNSGTIRNSGDASYDGGSLALEIDVQSGNGKFDNSGTIEAAGRLAIGGRIEADRVDFSNTGTIQANGAGGAALLISAVGEADPKAPSAENCDETGTPTVVANIRNDGIIRANGGGVTDAGGDIMSVGLGVTTISDNTIVRVTNGANGVIEATGAKSVAIGVASEFLPALTASTPNTGSRVFELDNAGTIRGGAGTRFVPGDTVHDRGAGLGDAAAANGGFVAGAIQTAGTTDKIRNLAGGVIQGSVDLADGDDVFENYGRLAGDLTLGSGADTLVFAASSVFEGIAYGGDGVDTLLVDLSGNGAINFDLFKGFETLKQKGSGTLAISGTADLATLTIANSNITVATGTRFASTGTTALTGSDGDETLNVEGIVAGNVDMGGGKDVVALATGGTVEGNVSLGAGDDRLVLAGGTVTGTIDGGLGTDTIAFNIAGDVSAIPDVINFESLDVTGAGTLSLALKQDFDTITLGSGSNLVLNPGATTHNVGSIIGNDGVQNVTINTPLTGGVSLGGGDDSLTLALNGALSGALDGGAGNDVLNLNLGGASAIGGLAGFEIVNLAGAAPLTLNGALAQGQALNFDGGDNQLIVGPNGSILGTVNGGAGRDSIAFDLSGGVTQNLFASRVTGFEDLIANGAGTLILNETAGYQSVAINGGNLTLAAGVTLSAGSTVFDGASNELTLAAGASIIGPVDGGAGTDRLVLQQAAGETRALNSLSYSNFEQLATGGSGTLLIDNNASFDSVDMFGSNLKIVNGATLTTGQLTGSAGVNTLEIAGALNGNVDLGAGDDRLIIASLNNGTGTRSGGAGNDTLEFRGAGTNAWNGTGYSDFENFANGAGTLSITGNVGFQNFAVTGGRVIGQAGTTITSANSILVGQGATFGSAGTVNASIDVRGTLSPGASPGTMTVNGNVAFASGSNLLLELAPTGRDLLNISGTLSIASGSTIDITGALSSAPGGAIDLVVAGGGITGGFTTINKSQSIFGFVAQRGNKIQIVGEFANDTSFGTNAQASIAYANAVLRSGQKVAAFTAALPDLVDTQGKSRQAAFAQLTPEAYASASRIGIDNGLLLADSARSLRYTMPEEQGLFGFGQGLFGRSELDGNKTTGASSANGDASGLIGGIGYGFGNGMRVGGFIGHLDSEQKLFQLNASTSADGFVGGVFADARIGGLGLHALAAYDGADAKTTRNLPGRTSVAGSYGLNSWLVDLSADYDLDAGDMTVTPRAGLTWISTRREGVTEQGASAFGLSVQGKRTDALFADAGITLGAETKVGNLPLSSWVEAGIRHMLDGDAITASGVLTGVTGDGVLTVAGVDRSTTTARLGAGLGLDLSDSVRLNVGYVGEFGDAERHNLSGGISVKF